MKMTPDEVIDHQRRHGFANPMPPAQPTLPLIVVSQQRIDFFMDLIPPAGTSQQKGERVVVPKNGGRPFVHHFKKPQIENAEKELARALTPFRPASPFAGPLRLVTEWTWPWRASESKKNRAAGWMWRETQPDFDNVSKLLCDQMAALGFFGNDAQISDARVTKQWGDRPGIRITLEAMQNP